MSQPLMIRLLSASVAAANRAGEIIREVLSSGKLGLVQKGEGYNDPQTEADRRAQRCIVASLASQFPEIKIIGEESLPPSEEDQKLAIGGDTEEVLQEKCPPELTDVQEKDVVVWVDPLDGTKEFIVAFAFARIIEREQAAALGGRERGLVEHVTVLVGIAVRGRPAGGVIHQPFFGASSGQAVLGRTIWGMVGLGVRGANPIHLDQSAARKDGLKLVITSSHLSDLADQTVKSINPAELMRAGGCGNKILMVLEGRADAHVHPSVSTMKWDTCAGETIIQAAGGCLTDLLGRPLPYETDPTKHKNVNGLVVTMHKPTHEDILAKIPENVRKAFS